MRFLSTCFFSRHQISMEFVCIPTSSSCCTIITLSNYEWKLWCFCVFEMVGGLGVERSSRTSANVGLEYHVYHKFIHVLIHEGPT
jgi:hypothetical protein